MIRELVGRVGVVTGGAGGIGRAIGERFAAEQMKVVLADIDERLLDNTVGELVAQGADAIGVVTDVSDPAAVDGLRDATLAKYGGVHVVCNNAGVASGTSGHMWEHELNDWRWSVSIHLFGVINGINAFVPAMLERGEEGHIVNTTSHNGGLVPIPATPQYATCKSAIVTVSECLWSQLRAIDAPIGVSVLFPSGRTPGLLNTGIWRKRERPAEFESKATREQPADGRSALDDIVKAMEAAGRPVSFTPLEEVADQVVSGILANRFWMLEPSDTTDESVRGRTQSIIDRDTPDYLLGRVPPRPSSDD